MGKNVNEDTHEYAGGRDAKPYLERKAYFWKREHMICAKIHGHDLENTSVIQNQIQSFLMTEF